MTPPTDPTRARRSGPWTSIRGTVRRWFGREPADPLDRRDETFEPFDVDALKQGLELAGEAVRFGSRDLPRYDDTSPDAPQVRIRQHIGDQVDEAFRRANRELERLTDAIRARDIRDLADRARRLPDEVSRRASQETAEAEQQMESLGLRRRELQMRLDIYRRRHRLDRGPELKEPHHRKQLLTWTAVLALLQAGANALLFAQGMTYGLSAGLLMAAALGLFDVGYHFSLGRVATRVHAPERLQRVVGGAFLLLIAGSVAFWNLGLVHLRNGIRTQGLADGLELWWTNLRQDPFGFTDFGSFALLAIGLLCSILAVVSAWHWDEPIPVYRRLGRALREVDADLGYWRDRSTVALAEAIEEGQDELDRLYADIDHWVNVAEAVLKRMIRLRENLTVFLRDAERAHEALVRFYRDENRMARSGPPPAYFQQPPVHRFDHPLAVDVAEIRAFVEAQRELRATVLGQRVVMNDHVRGTIRNGGPPRAAAARGGAERGEMLARETQTGEATERERGTRREPARASAGGEP